LSLIHLSRLCRTKRRIDFFGPEQSRSRNPCGNPTTSCANGIVEAAYPKGHAAAFETQIKADTRENAPGPPEPQAHTAPVTTEEHTQGIRPHPQRPPRPGTLGTGDRQKRTGFATSGLITIVWSLPTTRRCKQPGQGTETSIRPVFMGSSRTGLYTVRKIESIVQFSRYSGRVCHGRARPQCTGENRAAPAGLRPRYGSPWLDT
jgi:hypothetical protein